MPLAGGSVLRVWMRRKAGVAVVCCETHLDHDDDVAAAIRTPLLLLRDTTSMNKKQHIINIQSPLPCDQPAHRPYELYASRTEINARVQACDISV